MHGSHRSPKRHGGLSIFVLTLTLLVVGLVLPATAAATEPYVQSFPPADVTVEATMHRDGTGWASYRVAWSVYDPDIIEWWGLYRNGVRVAYSSTLADWHGYSVSYDCRLGDTVFELYVRDRLGNQSYRGFTLHVVDTTAPNLTVPADVTVDATGSVGTQVSFGVSATDLVDGTVTPRTAPASGLAFPIGETTVWVTATDSAGNTSTDSFLVTVLGPTETIDRLVGEIVGAPEDPATKGGIALTIKGSLLAKLDAALAALNRGNKNDAKVAMNDLRALINQVLAQTAKAISPEAAAAITSGANGLIDALGAPAPSVPVTYADFTGLDDNGTEWLVQVDAVANDELPLGAGTISLASSQLLPDGTQVQQAFTVSVEGYFSVEYYPIGLPGGWVDAGAAVGMCGPVVASTGGAGVPAVGEYYLFLGWDGAQGYTDSDGTVGHYPDRWTVVPWGGSDIASYHLYLRALQRTVLMVFASYGMSYRYAPDTNPDTYLRSLWPVIRGDISVMGGKDYSVY